MFAMLFGAWPRVTAGGLDLAALEADVAAGRRSAENLQAAVEALVVEAVEAQIGAGMGFVTDGHVRWADPEAAVLEALAMGDTGPDGLLLRAWRATAAVAAATGAGVPAAQAVPGPYSLGRRAALVPGASTGLLTSTGLPGSSRPPGDREALQGGREAHTLRLAATMAGELAALAMAGCPLVVVQEPAAVDIGADPAEGALFAAAQGRLLADVGAPGDGMDEADGANLHAMLAITGGSAAETRPELLFAAPYRSHLFDLVTGPDNWVLVRAAPPERGIVCGALTVGSEGDQAPVLVWAAHYAASAGGRGLERVGLANATPLAALDPAAARRALEQLGRAAELAAMPLGRAVEEGLDPRTIGSRTMAPGSGTRKPPA
jgi:hypothetical protein